jgi:hypothetical protein
MALAGLLRARHERPRSHAAEQRDELASFQLIELHSVLPAELQDIELAANSQRASERLYNLLVVGESGRCRGHSRLSLLRPLRRCTPRLAPAMPVSRADRAHVRRGSAISNRPA